MGGAVKASDVVTCGMSISIAIVMRSVDVPTLSMPEGQSQARYAKHGEI